MPVVTTAIGAEGMGLVDQMSALINDDPKDFAAAVVRLLTDAELWENLSVAGRKVIAAQTEPAVITLTLQSLFDSLEEK